ncbi:MAG: hypothetical protein LBH06_07095 [Rikenellaceae bacterium]|nr:hypothetical protein [Rikenellaceae bacterium]
MNRHGKEELIRRVLAKQLDLGHDPAAYNDDKYGADNVMAASECLYRYFVSKGDTPPPSGKFDSLVREIFGVEQRAVYRTGPHIGGEKC